MSTSLEVGRLKGRISVGLLRKVVESHLDYERKRFTQSAQRLDIGGG
jgi:hypothetical protein